MEPSVDVRVGFFLSQISGGRRTSILAMQRTRTAAAGFVLLNDIQSGRIR